MNWIKNIPLNRIITKIVFLCIILMDWSDIFTYSNALFRSSYAHQPAILVGQLIGLTGIQLTAGDFASFVLATSVSLTIYVQGSDLINRLTHKERPWAQWGMFILSAVISLIGNGGTFFQNMFGTLFPFISDSWITPLLFGFFVSYGLFSIVTADAFSARIRIQKAREVKFTIKENKATERNGVVGNGGDTSKPEEKPVKKTRSEMTPEERRLKFTKKSIKTKQAANGTVKEEKPVTAIVPFTTISEVVDDDALGR